MAVWSQTINWDNVSTLTERRFLPKLIDNIFRSNALMRLLYDKGTLLDGGDYITAQLIYGEGPGGPFDGTQELDTSESEIVTPARFNWKHYYTSATIRRQDELRNSGRARFASLLQAKMTVMQKSMKNHIGRGIHGSATIQTIAINGLDDVFTTSGVYGGFSTALNAWWSPVVVDMTGVAQTMSQIRTILGRVTEDDDTPDVAVGDQTEYNRIYNTMEPQKRYMDSKTADAGFQNILVEGRRFLVDSHAAPNTVNWLNTDYLELVTHQDENMRGEGWVKPYNGTARSYFMFWYGNLICNNRRFQARQTNVGL